MSARILVVDDEEDLATLVRQYFRKRIHTGELLFDFARNGAEALEKLTNDEYPVVFTDLNMPVMDGLALLSNMHERNVQAKAVVVTAYGDMDNIRTAMNSGAFDFIVKPIDFSDYELTLQKALNEQLKLDEGRNAQLNFEKERREKEELILKQNEFLEQEVGRRTADLMEEKKKSDALLLNILPEEVAAELKLNGHTQARYYENATVLFTDFKDFTLLSEQMSPQDLVNEIDYCFKQYDEIISKYNIEKIKTVGDSYVCASGLPKPYAKHASDIVNAAMDIVRFTAARCAERKAEGRPCFELRCGINSGPLIAGVVGTKKFAYDIWGDTVNTAARMEQSSEPGKINVSAATYQLVKDEFTCTHRGKIPAKNKGETDMYFIEF